MTEVKRLISKLDTVHSDLWLIHSEDPNRAHLRSIRVPYYNSRDSITAIYVWQG